VSYAVRPKKGSLCEIFNDLEKDGYRLVTAGGASELVFVFHKEGIVEGANQETSLDDDKKEKKKKKEKV